MNKYNKYDGSSIQHEFVQDDLSGIAGNCIDKINKFESKNDLNLGTERSVERLKEVMGTDLRTDVSPRLFSFISGIVSMIEDIEGKDV